MKMRQIDLIILLMSEFIGSTMLTPNGLAAVFPRINRKLDSLLLVATAERLLNTRALSVFHLFFSFF